MKLRYTVILFYAHTFPNLILFFKKLNVLYKTLHTTIGTFIRNELSSLFTHTNFHGQQEEKTILDKRSLVILVIS